jgi:hypothetical protein
MNELRNLAKLARFELATAIISTMDTYTPSISPSPLSPAASISSSSSSSSSPSSSLPEQDTAYSGTVPDSDGEQPLAEGGQTEESDDSITCQWEDCGIVFVHLETLIDHLHNRQFSFSVANHFWTFFLFFRGKNTSE